MAGIAKRVVKYIKELGAGIVFTTSELLFCGKRNTVDKTLSRLVSNGFIKRLASGVFILEDPSGDLPSAFDIIHAKARAFKKRICKSVEDAKTFITNGCKSSFRSIHGRLEFKPVCPKKFEKIGQVRNESSKNNERVKPREYSPANFKKTPRTYERVKWLLDESQDIFAGAQRRLLKHIVLRFPVNESKEINYTMQFL